MGTLIAPAAAVRRQSRGTTPEIYFAKRIDNSRLVKVNDPERMREMGMFFGTAVLLFLLVMVYAWQHFSSIECGYRVEQLRTQRDGLVEMNRALRLEEASLRDPQRIDLLARQMGLAAPQAGQVVRLDSGTDSIDPGAPVMARVSDAVRNLAVVSPQ
jgi:cell division protein FtsL